MIKPDEKIIDALVTLLESNVGYQISFFGGRLAIYQLEDRRFVVNAKEYISGFGDKFLYEEIFENAREAVNFFEQERRKNEIGFDIEGELYRKDLSKET